MDSYNTDDVTLELSSLIEELSEKDCENVKFPHKGSNSPASYKQIMRTKFPPNSLNFVKSEQSTDNTKNSLHPSIIDTVAGINIYSRQVLTMKEVDSIAFFNPKLDNLLPTTSDKEKVQSYLHKEDKDNVVHSSELQQNSEADPSISETLPSSQDKFIENISKDDNVDKTSSDTPLPLADNSTDNQRVSSFENGEPYEKNVEEPFSDGLKASEEEKLITALNSEEQQDVKSEEESNVREDDNPKSSYFSPCCFGLRSASKNELNEDTEYGPNTVERDSENDVPGDDMEYENLKTDSNEEKELLRENSEYKLFVESDEETLLPSKDTESDLPIMSNDEEKDLPSEDLEYTQMNTGSKKSSDEQNLKSAASVEENEPNIIQDKLDSSTFFDVNLNEQSESSSTSNGANESQEPENSEFSYVNLEDQRGSGVISDSKNDGRDEYDDPSNKPLTDNEESNSPSSSRMTLLNSIEDQDLLSSADSKKKKSSILKRLFSKKRK